MLDRYYEGVTDRISPEAPVPVVRVRSSFDRPGGAANVALNLASLGVQVTFLAFVGADPDADALRHRLEEAGVACRFIASPTARTIVKLRVLSLRQQVIRLDFEDGFHREDHAALATLFRDQLADHDLAVLSDYGKGTLTGVSELIAAARVAAVPVLVDPKGADFTRYAGAAVITPNASEFATVAGRAADETDFASRAFALRDTLRVDHLLVTRGERGMSLFGPDGAALSIPAEAREVYDVTGAGDTVIATLAVGMACGLSIVDAMRLANVAAGIVVSRKGTAAVTLDELSAVAVPHAAFADPAATLRQIQEAKRRGERIVMTNGCFDILHAGHVDYLSRAKSLGHKLVVAVNTDASVRRLKGAGRPVNPLEQRMTVLHALKAVDWVLPFDGSVAADGTHDDTPLDIISTVMPHVLVKGGDYTFETIVGAREVAAAGGEVLALPFVDGLSTTNMIKRLTAPETSA